MPTSWSTKGQSGGGQQWHSQDFKKGVPAAAKFLDRKPHPLIMMSLLSLPEGVTTKNNYSTKYSQA